MMILGTKPTTYSSTLTGLPLRIYTEWLADGLAGPETQIETTVGDNTYTEPLAQKNSRVLKDKLKTYGVAKAIIDEFVANAQVNNISSIVNTSLSTAATGSQDGGALLKTNFGANLLLNNELQKGTIS